MKWFMRVLALVALPLVMLVGFWSHNRPAYAQYGHTAPVYTCTSVAVVGAATPFAIITPGQIHWFQIQPEAAATTGFVRVFPYSSPLPTGVPAGTMQLNTTTTTTQALNVQYQTEDLITAGQGWAAVANAAATITVDACYR